MANALASFDTATHVKQLVSHEYQVNLHADWGIGITSHGGFMNALLLKFVEAHFSLTLATWNQPDTVSAHVEYLRRAANGEALVKVEDLRLGKQTSVVSLRLIQQGQVITIMTATNTSRSSSNFTLPTNYTLTPPVPPIDFDKVLINQDPHWISFHVPPIASSPCNALSRMTFAITKECSSTELAFNQQWIRNHDPSQRFTTPMLGLVIDHFVIPVENFIQSAPRFNQAAVRETAYKLATQDDSWIHPMAAVPRWYITLNSTLEIKKNLPPEGVEWLFTRMTVKTIVEGRFDIHCEVLDEGGSLVALSQQLWMTIEMPPSLFFKSGSGRKQGKL